ncbi:hypothetical protein LUZ60_003851 [Juncus effusus]|nr:hypothetical protein LUZ60_003851 [Juncus effusus]
MTTSENGSGASGRERVLAIQLGTERRIQASKDCYAHSAAVFRLHLKSTRALAERNHGSLEKLDKLKEEFTELQAEYSRAQSVKTRNDSKMNVMKEELEKQSEQLDKIKTVLSDKQSKLEEDSSIVSNTSSNLKSLESKVVQDEEHLNMAIGWYQNVLGFQVIGGNEGLTFIFTKINSSDPKKEYSFTVKLEKNKFILSRCDPFLEVDELVKELNETKDLFRFVRVMRAKFASVSTADTDSMNSESDQQASSPVISPVIPPVESTPVINKSGKGKKGLKTPSSSVRRSTRLRVILSFPITLSF